MITWKVGPRGKEVQVRLISTVIPNDPEDTSRPIVRVLGSIRSLGLHFAANSDREAVNKATSLVLEKLE